MAEIDPTRTATLRADFRRALQQLPIRARRRALEILKGWETITEDTIQQVLSVIEEELGREKALKVLDYFLPLAYQRGVQFALRKLRIAGVEMDLTISIADEENIAALRGLTLEYIRGIRGDLRKKLRETLVRANLENWSRRDLYEKIAQDFNMPIARAQTIARTETIRAFNTGAWSRYQAAGFQRWQWLTAADERVCPICGPRDGNVYPASAEKPPLHPNCRCTLIPAKEQPSTKIEYGGDKQLISQLKSEGYEIIPAKPLPRRTVEKAVSKIDHNFKGRVDIVLEPYRAIDPDGGESFAFVRPLSYEPLKLERRIHLPAGTAKFYARRKMWAEAIKRNFPEKEALIKKLESMTIEDLIASSVLHDYGHIRTAEKIINAKNLSFLEEYFSRREVQAALAKYRKGSWKWRQTLSEIIAEDYRVMKGSPIPNQIINWDYPFDLENPKLFLERKKILEKVFDL